MSNIQRVRYADSTALSSEHHFTTDSMTTYDSVSQFTVDSTGAFLISELERLDQTAHPPLAMVSWPRDIDLREDVQLGDDFSSFTLQSFGAPGGITPAGINWISKETNSIPGVALDIGKIMNPLTPWGMEMKYTILELASAARVGRPLDTQMYDGIQLKHQMDIDQMVYIGDSTLGRYGMLNSPLVTATNAVNGASGSPLWANKTPNEMLADLNTLLNNAWTASALTKVPTHVGLPPAQFSYLAATLISTAGNSNILTYLSNNSIANQVNGRPLVIVPMKYLVGRGVSGTNRMIAWTKDKDFIRFPLVPMQRTPVENRSIWQIVTYYAKLGVTEVVYPETVQYADGI